MDVQIKANELQPTTPQPPVSPADSSQSAQPKGEYGAGFKMMLDNKKDSGEENSSHTTGFVSHKNKKKLNSAHTLNPAANPEAAKKPSQEGSLHSVEDFSSSAQNAQTSENFKSLLDAKEVKPHFSDATGNEHSYPSDVTGNKYSYPSDVTGNKNSYSSENFSLFDQKAHANPSSTIPLGVKDVKHPHAHFDSNFTLQNKTSPAPHLALSNPVSSIGLSVPTLAPTSPQSPTTNLHPFNQASADTSGLPKPLSPAHLSTTSTPLASTQNPQVTPAPTPAIPYPKKDISSERAFNKGRNDKFAEIDLKSKEMHKRDINSHTPTLKNENSDQAPQAAANQTNNPSSLGVQGVSSTTHLTGVNTQDRIDLVSQLVAQIMQITKSDRTDTMMTLQSPPLFNGAQVTISEFNIAKGEFTLSFNNLSPQAAALILDRTSQSILKESFERQGLTAHIYQVSQAPSVETHFTDSGQNDTFKNNDREGGSHQQEQSHDEGQKGQHQ